MARKIVHVVGTGTIGEPLIGLLCDFKDDLGIDEVTFHKNTPLLLDRSKVVNLLKRGARLSTNKEKFQEWQDIVRQIANLKQLFEIKRATWYDTGEVAFQRQSPAQNRAGTFAPCPVCSHSTRQFYWSINNISCFQKLFNLIYSHYSTVFFSLRSARGT